VFVDLGIKHAMGICHSHLWPAQLHKIFPHSHKEHNFRKKKKKLLKIKCVAWFSLRLLSQTFHILRITEENMIKNVHRSTRKAPLFLSDFNETCIFSFHENPSSGSRAVPCGQKVGRTDRRTNMTKLIVVLRNSAKAPKNCSNDQFQ
jgi:hypothetical protein